MSALEILGYAIVALGLLVVTGMATLLMGGRDFKERVIPGYPFNGGVNDFKAFIGVGLIAPYLWIKIWQNRRRSGETVCSMSRRAIKYFKEE